MNTPSDHVPPNSPPPPHEPPTPPSHDSAPPPPPPPHHHEPANELSADERQWGMFAHLSALIGGLLTGWSGAWGVFVGPLIIWLVKKDTMPFVDDQGKEALNFNITIAIACVALLLLSILTIGIGLILAVPLWIIIGIYWLVVTIVAAVKANEGIKYRYPLTLRLIK